MSPRVQCILIYAKDIKSRQHFKEKILVFVLSKICSIHFYCPKEDYSFLLSYIALNDIFGLIKILPFVSVMIGQSYTQL